MSDKRAPFPYVGGKARHADWIVEHIPERERERDFDDPDDDPERAAAMWALEKEREGGR